jgi:hypothetical protein
MKKAIIALVMLVGVGIMDWAGSGIPEENQIILENQDQGQGPRSLWVPDKEQTARALEVIVAYLNKPLSPEWKNRQRIIVRNRFSSYCVQFVGILVEGRKALHCNFFPAADDPPRNRKTYVYVLDGGASYWRINVDTEEDRCFDFDVNGEA